MGDHKRKRVDGGGQAGNKQKYFQSNSKAAIPLQSRGFLISCVTGKERQASQEAIALLNEYLAVPAATGQDAQAVRSTDFSKLIEDEIQEIKTQKGKVFEWHKTNVGGLLYIRLTSEAGDISPVHLVSRIAEDVQQSKQCKSRLCMRFLPIETVCHASLDEIRKASSSICQHHFLDGKDTPAVKFAVQYEHRASVKLKRAEVIDAVVEGVPQPPHVVNLSTPDKTIIVQLMKNFCAMSVVQRYKELGKFNLRELSLDGEDNAADDQGTEANGKDTTAASPALAADDTVANPEQSN